jgi:hypothetical protein
MQAKEETMSKSKYFVAVPESPGSVATRLPASTLADARRIARRYRERRDLKGQDVRIERADGRLLEYAGPAR